MKFESFYSSSKANLYVVTAANGKRLLVECGCTWKKLRQALNNDLSNIVGCLLTHEHADHSKAIEDVLEAGIDVYASAGTFEALDIIYKSRLHVIRDRETFLLDGFGVMPFEVRHDATEPMGFVVYDFSGQEHLLFVTDTSHITQRFALEFNIIALCCGYDKYILRDLEESEKINTELAKRLLTSHMEWRETKRYISEFCNTDKCTEIHMLHMSPSNIDAEKVRSEFEKDFMIKTLIAGKDKRESYASRGH